MSWIEQLEKPKEIKPKISLWIQILLASIIAWTMGFLIVNPLEKLVYGILLAAIDFLVESLGDYFNLWRSKNSICKIFGVPIEVTLTCIFLGSLWAALKPTGLYFAVLYIWVTALTGTLIEQVLLKHGYIEYVNWTGIHALTAYTLMFTLLYLAA